MKKANWWFIGFTAFYAITLACVFWGTWSLTKTFIQPDCPVMHPADCFLRKWHDFCSGGTFVPGDLRFLIGGPYVWQELQYALAAYLAALGVAYYLKGRGVDFLPRYGAAAAYGLMGYNFTLFSAGHLGWFVYLMYGPFCFGLIDRCIRKGKWRNWAILGGIIAWSGAQQPDLWLLFTLMAFAYGVFRLAGKFVSTPSGMRSAAFVRMLAGVAVAGAVTLACGWPQLHKAIFVETANREKQMASSGIDVAAAADKGARKLTAAEKAAEREKRYVFCTNWSLPPDETLEFISADVNGASSDMRVSRKNFYSGRIGMQVAPGEWKPYRQHSLYMGIITMIFALVGVLCGLCKRKKEDANGVSGNRAEMAFWCIAAVVSLLCAFGAFTPFYRIVFALPAGDLIRCPIKFVHLLEWCIAVFAGFGASILLQSGPAKRFPRIAATVIGILLLANAINLACVDSRYCSRDILISYYLAVSRDTGSDSIEFAEDASENFVGKEYVLANGKAFRDNARLKKDFAEGKCSVVSYWRFPEFGFFTLEKTTRKKADYALMRYPANKVPLEGSPVPGPVALVSFLSTAGICGLLVFKATRKRRIAQC